MPDALATCHHQPLFGACTEVPKVSARHNASVIRSKDQRQLLHSAVPKRTHVVMQCLDSHAGNWSALRTFWTKWTLWLSALWCCSTAALCVGNFLMEGHRFEPQRSTKRSVQSEASRRQCTLTPCKFHLGNDPHTPLQSKCRSRMTVDRSQLNGRFQWPTLATHHLLLLPTVNPDVSHLVWPTELWHNPTTEQAECVPEPTDDSHSMLNQCDSQTRNRGAICSHHLPHATRVQMIASHLTVAQQSWIVGERERSILPIRTVKQQWKLSLSFPDDEQCSADEAASHSETTVEAVTTNWPTHHTLEHATCPVILACSSTTHAGECSAQIHIPGIGPVQQPFVQSGSFGSVQWHWTMMPMKTTMRPSSQVKLSLRPMMKLLMMVNCSKWKSCWKTWLNVSAEPLVLPHLIKERVMQQGVVNQQHPVSVWSFNSFKSFKSFKSWQHISRELQEKARVVKHFKSFKSFKSMFQEGSKRFWNLCSEWQENACRCAHSGTTFTIVSFQAFQAFQEFQESVAHLKKVSRDSKSHQAFQELSRACFKSDWNTTELFVFAEPCSWALVHFEDPKSKPRCMRKHDDLACKMHCWDPSTWESLWLSPLCQPRHLVGATQKALQQGQRLWLSHHFCAAKQQTEVQVHCAKSYRPFELFVNENYKL